MAIPTLTYSSETLTLTKKQRQKIETAEKKFLRNVSGYTLKDQIRNTVIRNELNIFSENNRIQNNRLNWIHRVGRMEPERIPKQLMDYTPGGTSSIGRPKSRWKDQPIQQRNGTDRKVQTLRMMMMMIKLLIMQFSPAFCHFIPRRSKYSPQHPVPKHP
jgi:hypothetical protein